MKLSQHSQYMIRIDIEDTLQVLNGVKSVIDRDKEYSEEEFKDECFKEIMKMTKGSLNPMKIHNIIDKLLN